MGLEVNLLIHTNSLTELGDLVRVLQAFPNLQKVMATEAEINEQIKKAEFLRAEIHVLEQQKAILLQPPTAPVPVAPVGM
jgi:hypothetical protein